jgi:hypothetical protein
MQIIVQANDCGVVTYPHPRRPFLPIRRGAVFAERVRRLCGTLAAQRSHSRPEHYPHSYIDGQNSNFREDPCGHMLLHMYEPQRNGRS